MDDMETFVRNLDRIVHHFEELDRHLIHMMQMGDDALKDHITQQIASVSDALHAADALERERVRDVERLLDAKFEGTLETLRVLQNTLKVEQSKLDDHTKARFEAIEARLMGVVPAELYDERHKQLAIQVESLTEWRANIAGRIAALAVLGTLFVAVVTALITHLISGG